jgi:copper chaperone CopZ
MKEIKINVEGMHCISCENRIKQKMLSKIYHKLHLMKQLL